jgi:hypothetical protein
MHKMYFVKKSVAWYGSTVQNNILYVYLFKLRKHAQLGWKDTHQNIMSISYLPLIELVVITF